MYTVPPAQFLHTDLRDNEKKPAIENFKTYFRARKSLKSVRESL